MRMTMRWFGKNDSVPLQHIAQVPNMRGIVGTFEGLPVGDVWATEHFLALKQQVESVGLTLDVIESIPVPEAVKLGLPERDRLIDNYCESIQNMGHAGIKVLCYNFMPLLDWMRTDMQVTLPDASIVTGYKHADMLTFDPSGGLEARVAWARGFTGNELQAHIEQYADIDENKLFEHFAYFLERVIPAAEEAGVFMALHPDDPPWSILGLPRIVRDAASIERILNAVDSPHNGLTFCTGSLGASGNNDLPTMIRQFANRIHFVHVRNLKRSGEQDFHETAHPIECGDVDVVGVMQALIDVNFTGPLRPDHGRLIWGETVPRTGYGLYDRALGAMYLQGIYDGLQQKRIQS